MKRLLAGKLVPLALLVLLAAGGRSLVLDAQGQVPAQVPAQLKGQAQSQVTSPEKFFGFQMGADRKIARWDKLVEYYQLLEKESGGKLKVVNMGPTEMGNPFLLRHHHVAGQPEEPRDAPAEQPQAQRSARDPRGRDQEDRGGEQAVRLHDDEHARLRDRRGADVAGARLRSPDAAATPETQRILDNVVFLLIPSFNPDGEIMVTDWYNKYLGTEYEGSEPAVAVQQVHRPRQQPRRPDDEHEGVAVRRARCCSPSGSRRRTSTSTTWAATARGSSTRPTPSRSGRWPIRSSGGRWRGTAREMANKAEEAGLSGVMNNGQYSGWGHFGFHWITPFHNIAGMLTESASARLATPLYIDPSQLDGRRAEPRAPQRNRR